MPVIIDGSAGINVASTTGVINLLGSTSGTLTLQANATAGTNTLTFPAATGIAVVADGSGNVSVTGNLSFNSGYGSDALAYGCRVWVNFNGSNTVAIRASGGVSSITDVNTGTYRINFATAMPDTNYSVVAGCVYVAGSGTLRTLQRLSDQPETTSNVTVIAYEESGGAVDPTICDVVILR
jgi:hypothetical protein